MNDLHDVQEWFRTNNFVNNPLITLALIGGRYQAPRILAILIWNNKNERKTPFTSRNSYINYLREV